VEECTYFWGVNTSWGIDTAESKGPLHQEDNQAPQPRKIASWIRDPRNPKGDVAVWNHRYEWGLGGIVLEDWHLGAQDLESQIVDIASGDISIGKSPTEVNR
jgi:hypothetical protein